MSTVRTKAVEAAAEVGALLEERGETHGDYTSNAVKASGIKEHMTSIEDPVLREAADAIAGKLARVASGGNPYEVDHFLDVAGYALLAVGYIRALEEDVRDG